MSDFNFQIYNKNALTMIFLSKIFLQLDIGSKLPTFDDLSSELGVARGTIQKALKSLQAAKAVEIRSRGHMGSYLTNKNNKSLLNSANINSFLGAMPLPYSKTYEGLATGIITSMENKYDIPVHIAYMRDAVKRIEEMLKGNYDFTIVCKSSAQKAIDKNNTIEIVADFGPTSYLSSHVILFSDSRSSFITDGMRVGLALGSSDQIKKTKELCKNKRVEFVTLAYDQVIPALKEKYIDATVWNKDEINDLIVQVKSKSIESNDDDTTAVLLANNNKKELIKIFKEIINIEEVRKIQTAVIKQEMPPKY
ncbi:MAG: GntR family transcriptional regulator YhfZ [Erysipelotrichaceae bacterium]